MDIVIGGGKYGCWAADFLRAKGRSFVVVDTNKDCLAKSKMGLQTAKSVNNNGEYFIQGDFRTVLKLIESFEPDFVFPTAPVHIAADLAKEMFDLEPWTEGINSVLLRLPQSVILLAGKGKLVASFNRDNKCLDRCSMPSVCPSSGTIKPCTMTELIKYASPEAYILVSHSMAPGMGALKGDELQGFFKWAESRDEFLVATTCDCHAVLSSFRKANSQNPLVR